MVKPDGEISGDSSLVLVFNKNDAKVGFQTRSHQASLKRIFIFFTFLALFYTVCEEIDCRPCHHSLRVLAYEFTFSFGFGEKATLLVMHCLCNLGAVSLPRLVLPW
jgi:hypothetical protein